MFRGKASAARLPLFFLGSGLSFVGDGLRYTALPLLLVRWGASNLEISGLVAVSTAPWLICSIASGTLVDRSVRHRLLATVDVIRTVVAGGLLLLAAADYSSVAFVYGLAFLLGVGETVFTPGSHALVPELVADDEELLNVNAFLARARTFGQELVGPALGGLLFSFSVVAPFGIDATSFAVSALCLTQLRPLRSQVAEGRPAFLKSVAEGLHWMASQRALLVMATISGLINFVLMAGVALSAPLILRGLHEPYFVFGLVPTVSAIAGIGLSLCLGRVKRLRNGHATLIAAAPMIGLGYALVGVGPGVVAAFCGFALASCGAMLWNVTASTVRQRVTPPGLRGRADSVYRLVSWGMLPVGSAAGGALALVLGVRPPYLVLGAFLAVVGIVAAPVLKATALKAQWSVGVPANSSLTAG